MAEDDLRNLEREFVKHNSEDEATRSERLRQERLAQLTDKERAIVERYTKQLEGLSDDPDDIVAPDEPCGASFGEMLAYGIRYSPEAALASRHKQGIERRRKGEERNHGFDLDR